MIPAYGLDNHMVIPDLHNADRINEAKALHKSGLGYISIGRRLNLSPYTIRNWCKGITRK